jgi:hypothetical protein
MDRFSPHPSSAAAAVRLAERLLAEAEACPALTLRGDPIAQPSESPSGRFPELALLSDPVLDVRPYLEHLVSMASAAAERSEALAQQARQRSRKAKWQMLAIGCLGAVALLIGVRGFIASRNSETSLAQLRNQVIALTEQQQQARTEIAELSARKDAARVATGPAASGRERPATPIAAAPALQIPSIRYYAQPWPDSRSILRQSTQAPSRLGTGFHFLPGFERGIQAVLR